MKQGLGDGADDYRQFDRQFVEILHKQNWAASMDMNLLSFIVPWWQHIKRCLQFRRNSVSQLFFFSLFGREYSAEILVSVWQEEENFEVLKRCYIQIYPTSF